jgi:CDP-paratose 2-epimerase
MKKYLITGGCGFLGSNIAAEIIRNGQKLSIIDNLSRHGSTENLRWLQEQGKFNFSKIDIRSSEDVNDLIAEFNPDVVFHLAGQVAMTTSIENPRLDFEINALGTFNLLEAVRSHCEKASVIYSSTNKVYGDLEHLHYQELNKRYKLRDYEFGLPETIGLDFHSPYGCSKGSADQYMLDFGRIYGIKTAVFRHSSMYGGRQYSTTDQGWVGWFCGEALRQASGDSRPFTISGDGKQVRDVLNAEDMVALYLSAAHNIDRIAGNAFNVGGGNENSLSILELLDMLESIIGIKLNKQHIAPRESDQRVFVADLTKIKSMLSWSPKITKEEGVRRMVNWVQSIKDNS